MTITPAMIAAAVSRSPRRRQACGGDGLASLLINAYYVAVVLAFIIAINF